MRRYHLFFPLALSALLALPPAHAEDEAPDFGATLTGDWGGTRNAAAAGGITLEGALKFDIMRNRGGALGNDGRNTSSHLELTGGFDFDKLWGWRGGSGMLQVLNNTGGDINLLRTGSANGVTNIAVPVPTTRLFQAWLQQALFDDALTVRVGLYPIDSEFFGVESAAVFLGPQYGTPADLAQTAAPSIFNNSAFGIRARWEFGKTFYAMGAVLDGVPNDPARPKATAIRFAPGDGAFNIGEIGWTPHGDDDKFVGHAKFALGLWGYSTRLADQLDGVTPRRRQGGYVLAEHTLVRLGEGDDRFLSGFARYTFTDGDTTQLKNTLNLGLHLKGPHESRPDDVIGMAWTRAANSAKWRDRQALTPTATTSGEDVLEIIYRYQATPWFAVQPTWQRHRNPGGVVGTPNANVLGVRLDLTL